MPVPNTFANATTTIPLSDLDNNFATPITIGNTAVQLGNTVTTLNNMTFANVTISSVASTFPNNYFANNAVTIGNTSVSLGSTQTTFGNVTLNNATIASGNVTITDATIANSVVISGNTAGDLVRITQVGTGNALLVEDSANPDSTPFVVAANGNVGIGTTTPITGVSLTLVPSAGEAVIAYKNGDDTGGAVLRFRKSRGTFGSPTIVQNGDTTGTVIFQGYDGTAFIRTAQITSEVDGTPGTNDMPGRLIFSTTADGASSPTERMRIDSSGQVGIGTAGGSLSRLTLGGTFTDSSGNTQGIRVAGTVPSTTTSYVGLTNVLATQAASFTLSQAVHLSADQDTLGAGSAVTTQIGFNASSSLTGATNNYGFYSDIASGTGRWNFYANGTANNAFAGSTSLGTTSAPTALVTIAAGTATANTAPLKFTSGTNLTTPEAGVVEYDGTIMTATSNTSFKRGTIPITNYTSGIGTSGITATTNYAIFPAANDTITLPIGTYLVRMAVRIAVSGSTSNQPCTLNIRGAGDAVGSFSWRGTGSILDAGAASSFVVAATALGTVITVTATSAANPRQYIFIGQGILKVTTAGTIIPAYQFPGTLTSGTTTLVADNYMTIQQLDTQSAAAFGPAGTGWG